jgi:hypothetical protein
VFDFSLRLQIFQSAELFFRWHLRIDSMQLVKINLVEAQPAQAVFAGGPQVLWLPVFNPLVGTWPDKTALGGDHQPCRIRVQCLGYDFFTHSRTIGIRGIDEIDS